MSRSGGIGEMHIDHHRPRSKRGTNNYPNLYLSSSTCNQAKGESWPTAAEAKNGLRFLDCCAETEYGEEIFEDPATHRLVGTTPAAKYHIRKLSLNHPTFITERHERAQLRKLLTKTSVMIRKGKEEPTTELVTKLTRICDDMIPEIPPPPAR